jgi:hypothetical protein
MQALAATAVGTGSSTPPAAALPPTLRAIPLLAQGIEAQNAFAEPLKDNELSAGGARGQVVEYGKAVNRNPLARLMHAPQQLPLNTSHLRNAGKRDRHPIKEK